MQYSKWVERAGESIALLRTICGASSSRAVKQGRGGVEGIGYCRSTRDPIILSGDKVSQNQIDNQMMTIVITHTLYTTGYLHTDQVSIYSYLTMHRRICILQVYMPAHGPRAGGAEDRNPGWQPSS